MELTFPFRNWTYHSLSEFFEMPSIRDYAESGKDIDTWSADEFNVSHYHDTVTQFQNELLQVIQTTNQETIDEYFNTFYAEVAEIRSICTEGYLSEIITKWNEDELHKFEATVTEKVEAYQKNPDRKRAHLEYYYEEYLLPLFPSHRTGHKYQLINYNYYCIEDKLEYVDPIIIPDYFSFLKQELELFLSIIRKYGGDWEKGLIKSRVGTQIVLKPIVFCEGDIDIDLITKAADVLDKNDLLGTIELRQRGEATNLDKLWSILSTNNWETIPQKKILLYDCDMSKQPEDFGHICRRVIPRMEAHKIQKGTENLFPDETLELAAACNPAFIDVKSITGTERGVPFNMIETNINKHEKRNFCDWIVANGNREDFAHFSVIFDIIENFLS